LVEIWLEVWKVGWLMCLCVYGMEEGV
jgi:hypothetical protein